MPAAPLMCEEVWLSIRSTRVYRGHRAALVDHVERQSGPMCRTGYGYIGHG